MPEFELRECTVRSTATGTIVTTSLSMWATDDTFMVAYGFTGAPDRAADQLAAFVRAAPCPYEVLSDQRRLIVVTCSSRHQLRDVDADLWNLDFQCLAIATALSDLGRIFARDYLLAFAHKTAREQVGNRQLVDSTVVETVGSWPPVAAFAKQIRARYDAGAFLDSLDKRAATAVSIRTTLKYV